MRRYNDDKDKVKIVKQIEKIANDQSEEVSVVFRLDKAKLFWSNTRKRIFQTRDSYKKLVKQVKLFKHLTHEVENLFDNYYIIDGAISDILNTQIEKGFWRLIQVEKKTNIFIPRIYSILVSFLKTTNYQIDRDTLYCFLQAYQAKTHLSIRELSFVPFFLKIILIDGIKDIMHQSMVIQNEYKEAEYWFEQIVIKGGSKDYSRLTSELTQRYGVLPVNLVFYLLQKLSQYGPDTRSFVKWLKLNLLKQGINISDLAEIENKRQNETSTKISNVIDSLRWINQVRWDNFVINLNIVDSFLLKDPAGVYSQLDQNSQTSYRNEIVKISDRIGINESEIARTALKLCYQDNQVPNNIENHVGYYLVGPGKEEFRRKIGYHKTILESIQNLIIKNAPQIYLGLILFITFVFVFLFTKISPITIRLNLISGLFLILAFILISDIVINLINIFVSSVIPVRSLYRLDLSSGVSEKQATFVAIPTMFRNSKSTEELLKRLEVNYLANSSQNVFFALLLGFKDSKNEIEVNDRILYEEMKQGIKNLNEKYPASIDRFYLFHRKRIWNPQEGVFMEWERKRGKVREFNLFLRNKKDTSFFETLPSNLPYIKYVLTIDEDARLPKDSVIKLIGSIDHPLNRPVIDKESGKVVSGYGIIQPRMTSKFSAAKATTFARLFSSAIGMDSYSGPVADVYQDLFDNSIFNGKGIYDIDTMEAMVGDRIPENQVLSHDLLEGIYTRVGLVTDVLLFEGFPEGYREHILRLHRWIRGDWQIISWLKYDKTKKNNFSLSDKWKIFDNLRRSSLPIFAIFYIFTTYIFFPSFYLPSLFFVLAVIGSPFIISYFFRFFQWPKEINIFMKINMILDDLDTTLWQIIFRFVFLLDQAVMALRAIITSTYRMLISRKNMLRWNISQEVSKNLKGTLREFIYIMWPAQVIALFFLILNSHNIFSFYLTLILWLVSPFIAYKISQKEKDFQYRVKDINLLRRIACRSSRFFLELSSRDSNHLIPDHYQEAPLSNTQLATSPTNIGMHILSNLSAYDFGYISFSNLLNRTKELFNNLNSLERYNGHFYNWYDIHSLQPLNPKYVSSVDSANLLVNLLTFKQGILDIIKKPILNKENLLGLNDVFAVLIEDANSILKDIYVSNINKKLAKNIYILANKGLKKLLLKQDEGSVSYYINTFSILNDINEKIKKIVCNLNLDYSRENLTSIYSSVEHLNTLLGQLNEEISIFMPFEQILQNKPVVRNEKKNFLLAEAMQSISLYLNRVPTLIYLNNKFREDIINLKLIDLIHSSSLDNGEKENIENWYHQIIESITKIENQAVNDYNSYLDITHQIDKFFDETNFLFLYNKERGLFHIGYNVTYDKIDNSYYDFLASEANAISFISILKKEVPIKQWFYLGRKLVRLNMKRVLLSSWGGSLFEYLTSLIFFRVHPESLLGYTAESAVDGHIKYGKKNRIPWGMGESAYSALDLNNNYQYQIFGHPDLGLKRDLKDYLVIAPYTTILALAFRPKEAIFNLKRLIKNKFIGKYGFYDAIDYTQSIDNFNKKAIPTKIYYAHHQGFSLQALNNQIHQNRMYSLFASDPRVESLDTLFEERIPSSVPTKPIKNLERIKSEYLTAGKGDIELKQFIPLVTSYPRRALISNGSYSVCISNSGSGYSNFNGLNLTRFREDIVSESWGQFIYLYDSSKNILWSPTTQPIGLSLGKNKIEYFENKACFNQIYNDIESSLVIAVAPIDNVEFRSLTITNHSKDKKQLQIADYGEVVLSYPNEDIHHTSFEKLFIKSDFWSKYNALVYSKPNKEKRGEDIYFAHKIIITSKNKINSSYLTSRDQFIIRGGDLRTPSIFSSGFQKKTLPFNYNFDPIFSFQNKLELEPNETITINYINIFSYSKNDLISNLKKYSNQKEINQAVKKSDIQGCEIANSFGLSCEKAINYQSLASRLLSAHYSQKIKEFKSITNEPIVNSLWRLGISGDLPILILRFYDMNDLALIKNVLLCHRYLKYKGIAHDLVFLNEYPSSYIKSFEDEVDFLIRYNQSPIDKKIKGGVFHLRSSNMNLIDKENLIYLSKIILDSKEGTIEQQILDILQSSHRAPTTPLEITKKSGSSGRDLTPKLGKLEFFNGLGGFDKQNREYVININYNKLLITPSPWTNIVTNKNIGSVITESGSMYTWLFDSYDNRLTKRIDDPLLDKGSEIFYLRDEETGDFWNPTPLPIKNPHTYIVKHGLGYTKFLHKSHGIEHEMSIFVPNDDCIKIVKFKLTNIDKISKKLSLTGFWEMSLGGAIQENTKDYLKTEKDQETGAVFIKNIYSESFKDVIAFIDLDNGKGLLTNDREEFLGKGKTLSNPSAMYRNKLSNIIHADVDHCVAMETFFEIKAGETVEIVCLIGGGKSIPDIQTIIEKYRRIDEVDNSLQAVNDNWNDILNRTQIYTPDESLNILFNTQLLYQLISSRLLARTGYYQPSGAYGFRDQLQDSMALVWNKPEMTKEIILMASRHQFLEGDGMNWWHEHNSFGVRSVCSDHQLWLPYVVSHYIDITHDLEILKVEESYVKAPILDFSDNSSWAGIPEIDGSKYDLYDHCLRAIEKTFVFGKHGLPLIGRGDWNDGLNLVGEKGQGESVWLGWFLYSVINKFIPYIQGRGDLERVERYKQTAKNIQGAIEKYAWDGKWYRRAFFDSGSLLGSSSNREFKIDSISQSWSVLSESGRLDRSKIAMNSAGKYLFQEDNLYTLIYPALKNSVIDPGYIKDYPPGVRENGAQYNHAALWSAQAFAKLKDDVSLMKIIDSVNPIKRSDNIDKVLSYRVEPYVVASDIYAKPAQAGRGGWTWYTGSAGVMYRTILESLLGVKVWGNKMEIDPCIPKDWPQFSLIYTYKSTKYSICVVNKREDLTKNKEIKIDGISLAGQTIDLIDDQKEHKIEINL